MADSLALTLHVCPTPGDDAREMAKLAGWLRSELLDLDVQRVERLPGEAALVDGKDPGDTAGVLLVHLNAGALKAVQAKVTDWVAQSDRVVEISAGDHTLVLRPPMHQEKVLGGPLAPETAEAVIDLIPAAGPNREPAALESGKALVPLRPPESLPLMQESGELSRRDWPGAALLGQESRRTAALVVILSLLGAGLAVLLVRVILAIARHYHGLSISTSYPFRRVYHGVVQYFIKVTPPPGSSHILLVYTVYLAVLPVLFAVVFMHLRVGSTKLIVAAVMCVIFMVAPFIIAITSFRAGAANCGSWNYPELNSGPECYNALTSAFRIAFAVGITGIAVPIIYLIRGRRRSGSLLQWLVACTRLVMKGLIFISNLARGKTRERRDDAADQRGATTGVDRYLLAHEQQVITVRRHPAVLIGPSVLAFDGLLAAGVLSATVLFGDGPLIAVAWIAWLVLFARMIWKAIDWAGTFFVITSQRMLLVSGVVVSKVAMVPLAKVTDMSFQRSSTGRLLGFGEFVIESAGQDKTLVSVDHIPYPEQLYLEVCGLIFPDRDLSDD